MTLYENVLLNDLGGLSNLRELGGLWMGYNHALTQVDGFSNLETVVGDVDIADNDMLANLDGLSGIEVGGHLAMFWNEVLCQSVVDAWLETISVGGYINAFSNDPDCSGNSELEVDEVLSRLRGASCPVLNQRASSVHDTRGVIRSWSPLSLPCSVSVALKHTAEGVR